MRIAYDNDFDTDTSPTVTSEETRYPFSNTRDQRLSTKWRSTSTVAQTIVVQPNLDVGGTFTAAILGHNLSSAATVSLALNHDDSWGSPRYSTTLTVVDGIILKFVAEVPNYDGDNLLLESGDNLLMESGDAILLEESTWEYARFVITDTSNTDGYVEAGRFFLGPYLSIDPSSLHDFTVVKKRSDTVIYGKDRHKFANPGVGWRRFELTFPPTDGTMLAEIQDMYDSVGNHTSFIFANFNLLRVADGKEYQIVEPCYVSIDGDITFQRTGRGGLKFNYSLALEEDR